MHDAKIEVLDSLRAFAAISVCLFHFVCTTKGYVQTPWVLKTFEPGSNGVLTFFVISGFIIPWAMYNARYSLNNFFTFFLKRLARLEPPYLFSVALSIIVLLLREKIFGKQNDHVSISGEQIALHIGYLIPFFKGYHWLNQVYWTLAIEFQYYLLIALVFAPLVSAAAYVRYLFYTLGMGISVLSSEVLIFYWLPIFLFGIVLFLYKSKRIKAKEFYIVTIALLIFSFWMYPIVAVIYALIPIPFVLFRPGSKFPVLHFTGKFSYSIYLIHPILGASLINVLSHYFTSGPATVTVIILGVIATLLGSYLSYLIIERPSKRLSSRMRYK